MGLVDHPRTPKLWAIAHENGHTCKKDKFFLLFLSRMYRLSLMRVNSTNVLVEGLRIREIGCQMNSKVKFVKQGVYRK
jgi:hypothetical protein